MAPNLIIPDDYSPVISLDEEGIHVIDEKLAEKLNKKSLSPSAVTALLGCPAKFLFSSFVERDVFDDSGSMAAKKGSLFHKVMEDFFALPNEERTPERVKEFVNSTLLSKEFSSMASDVEVIAWLRDAVNGYYSMGAKPENVEIAMVDLDHRGKPKPGLEVFIKGRIGEASRDTLGFIDRLTVDKKSDGKSVIVEDWKTGEKAKRYTVGSKDEMGLGEARQQVIYKILLEQKGISVSKARLIFPVARDIVNVDVHDEKFIQKTVNDVEEADKVLSNSIKNNTFEYGPSFLCAWCPLVKICPAANTSQFRGGKPLKAFESQPPVEDLQRIIA